MIRRLPILAVLLAGCAADRAGGGDRAGGACFFPSQVSGFSDAGPDRAVLRVGTTRAWELTLANGCPDVDYAQAIAIRSRSGERVCPGRPAELIVPELSGRGGRTCLVTAIRRLSPEEAAAVPGISPQR